MSRRYRSVATFCLEKIEKFGKTFGKGLFSPILMISNTILQFSLQDIHRPIRIYERSERSLQ